jgi:hypothetical protein
MRARLPHWSMPFACPPRLLSELSQVDESHESAATEYLRRTGQRTRSDHLQGCTPLPPKNPLIAPSSPRLPHSRIRA